MFSAIASFFNRQLNNLERAHSEVSWEEALDNAVMQIDQLKDIESEKGKKKLEKILEELRQVQQSHEYALNFRIDGEEAPEEDAEGQRSTNERQQLIVHYNLPWDGIAEDESRQLTKCIFGLGVDEEALLLQEEELEYEFDFNMDHYVVLAQIMLKLDLNLKKTRHELVPEMITEDDFWRNYFFKIELIKKNMGLEARLGAPVAQAKIEQSLLQKRNELDDEEAAMEESTSTLRMAAQVAESDEIELKTLSEAHEDSKEAEV